MTLKFSSSESRAKFSLLSKEFKIGDSRAEIQIFERLVDPLLKLVKRRLNKNYQAKFSPEDIVQATFISFIKRHRREPFNINDANALWAIMAKIAIRKCASEIRRYQRPKRDVRKETQCFGDFDTKEFAFNGLSHEPDPQKRLESADTVNRILNKLKPMQRNIVLLKLRGYNNKEISKNLNMSERSVYRSLSDVKFHLKRLQKMMPAFSYWHPKSKKR